MNIRHGRQLGLAFVIALAGCARAPEGTDTTTTSPTAPSEPTASPTIQDIMELPPFSPLEPGTYFMDPDVDPSTPLRVVYEVPVEGWSGWAGAAKFAGDGHVAMSITTVTNLVRHGCRDHSWADPPVGPSVDDLAAALADLAPFRVTSPPKDVTIYSYSGKYLELTVPDLPVEEGGDNPRRGSRTPLHRMHRRQPQELGRTLRHSTGGRVLRLHGPRLQRGVLDP